LETDLVGVRTRHSPGCVERLETVSYKWRQLVMPRRKKLWPALIDPLTFVAE
jgi:hypothetical protein